MPGEVGHLIDPISSGLCHISLAREKTLHIVVSPEKTCSHLTCFQWRDNEFARPQCFTNVKNLVSECTLNG